MNIASLTFAGFIKEIISSIIQPITVLIFALSILYFLWNVTQFIRKSDDPEEIKKFKTNAMWGIVAIFVMASMWGLVQILINSFVPGTGVPSFNSGSASPIKGGITVPALNTNINYRVGGTYYSEQTGPNGTHGYSIDLSQTNFPVTNK